MVQNAKMFKEGGRRDMIITGCLLGYDAAFLGGFLAKLVVLHWWLLVRNSSYYEYVKKKLVSAIERNPYDRGCWRNVYWMLCRRIPKARVDMRVERNNGQR